VTRKRRHEPQRERNGNNDKGKSQIRARLRLPYIYRYSAGVIASCFDHPEPLNVSICFDYRCNETISSARNRLDESRFFRVVIQDLTNLADRAVYAVIGIDKNALAPNLLDNLLPPDQFPAQF